MDFSFVSFFFVYSVSLFYFIEIRSTVSEWGARV